MSLPEESVDRQIGLEGNTPSASSPAFLRKSPQPSGFHIALLLLLFAIVFSTGAYAQFLVGDVVSQDMTACNGQSQLAGSIIAQGNPSSGGTVIITLATGVEYVPGSVASVGGTGTPIAITESDISNLNQPEFTIAPSSIALGSQLQFIIKKQANCNARDWSNTGGTFSDQVQFNDGTHLAFASSNTYNVFSPELAVIQPATQSDIELNQTGTRTFRIKNGAEGCANNIVLNIETPNNLEHQSLSIFGVALTASSTSVGTTHTTYEYILNGATLGTGHQLCNGEFLEFTETFKVTGCSADNSFTTNYSAAWGCGTTVCETVTGTGLLNLIEGSPAFTNTDFELNRIGYTNLCSNFQYEHNITNSGSGHTKQATMYNVNVTLGKIDWTQALNTSPSNIILISHTINSLPIPATVTGGGQSYKEIELKNLFTTDPDGAGVGLEDMDGDGYYDDLPNGNTLTLLSTATFDCSAASSSPSCLPSNTADTDSPLGVLLEYTTYCDSISTIQKTNYSSMNFSPGTPWSLSVYRKINIQDVSYMPANISEGTPTQVALRSNWYDIHNAFGTTDGKYVYTITLPAGMSILGTTVQFRVGEHPYFTVPQTVPYTQTGSVVTVISPSYGMGGLTFDVVYDCATGGGVTNPTISYQVDQYNDYPSCLPCVGEGFVCGELTTNVICTGATCATGVSTGIPVVERNDNSLGWTDHSMTTVQSRSSISAYDLSKCLYLDEFNVKAAGRQHGTASNLGARLNLDKDTNNNNSITALTADLRIVRAGATIVDQTGITTFTYTNSTATEQIVDWDLTAYLPFGGLLDGDSIYLTSNYQVSSKHLVNSDVMVGNSWQLYNSTSTTGTPVWSNAPISCWTTVPEMFFAGTIGNSHSNYTMIHSCQSFYWKSNLARRFNSNGTEYTSEYRPGLRIKKYYLKTPKRYEVQTHPKINNYSAGGGSTPLPLLGTTDLGTHTLYEYEIPLHLQHFNITYTNEYSARIYAIIATTCAMELGQPESNQITHYFDYIDYYYHAAAQPTIPPFLDIEGDTIGPQYRVVHTPVYSNKPSIVLANQTGAIQMTEASSNWVVRMENPTSFTAPYTWLAIPTASGVTINSVVDVTTGTALTGTPYTGGVMYQISTTGITGGTFKDYQINFTSTLCVPGSINVLAGWNCTSFPTSVADYTCGPEEITLNFVPETSAIETKFISTPTGVQPLCDTMTYTMEYQSTGRGNVLNSQLGLVAIPGVDIVEVVAEYPAGSGNTATLTSTLSGGVHNIDLSAHPMFPATGLPGTLSDGGNALLRTIGITVKILTDCNFTSGSELESVSFGDASCGIPATGNGTRKLAPSLNIDGAEANYDFVSSVTPVGGSAAFSDCGTPVTLNLAHVFYPSSFGASTTADAQVRITLPQGYSYVTGSFANTAGSINLASIDSVVIGALSTETIYVNVPAGINVGGSNLLYSIQVQENPANPVACNVQTIHVTTTDKVGPIACGTNPPCASITTQTGDLDYLFIVEKASLNLTVLSATTIPLGSVETITAALSIENTSTVDLTTDIYVEAYFDNNSNGVVDAGDVLIGNHTITTSLAGGATLLDSMSFNATSAQTCNIILTISQANNMCICGDAEAALGVPTAPNAQTTQNLQICANTSQVIGSTGNSNNTYSWTGILGTSTAPLSATNIAQPTFNAADTGMYHYIVTTTLQGGCSREDSVNIQVVTQFTATDVVETCDEFTWINGITYTATGTYLYTMPTASGCDSVVTLNLTILPPSHNDCFSDIKVPGGFSPNDDDINDVLVIEGIDNFPGNVLSVYNRWGTLVFQQENYQNDWTGTVNQGMKVTKKDVLPTGTYFYILDVKDPSVGDNGIVKGYIFIKKEK